MYVNNLFLVKKNCYSVKHWSSFPDSLAQDMCGKQVMRVLLEEKRTHNMV